MGHEALHRLIDHQAISAVIHRYASAVDARDWKRFGSCFTDPVWIDLSSWNGAPPQSMPRETWVSGVRAGLSGFDATQHLSANHVIEVDGEQAHCTSFVQAIHCLGDARVVLGGHYDTDLSRKDDGWRIHGSRLSVTWREGDQALFAAAAGRGKAAPGG